MQAQRIKEVSSLSGQGLEELFVCLGCKICASVCPLNDCGLEVNPRDLLTALFLGEPLDTEAPLIEFCVGCYRCTEECPWGIRVPEVIRALRSVLGLESAFERAFRSSVGRYGRVRECYVILKTLPFLVKRGYGRYLVRWLEYVGLGGSKRSEM